MTPEPPTALRSNQLCDCEVCRGELSLIIGVLYSIPISLLLWAVLLSGLYRLIHDI